jgi:hypothetical protein
MLRVVAIALFGLMFLAEVGDIYGLFLTLVDPARTANPLGTSVLLLLALAVAMGALLALIGLLARRPTLFHRSALACALGYLVYGVYQVADGALLVGSGIVAVAGMIYVVLGSIAYAMHRSISQP